MKTLLFCKDSIRISVTYEHYTIYKRWYNEKNRKKRYKNKFILLLAIIIIIAVVFYYKNSHKSLYVPLNKQSEQWNLMLVNDRNKISKDYTPKLIELNNGKKVSEDIIDCLQKMFDHMRADGFNPEVTSGYRSREEQKEVYEEYKRKYKIAFIAERWVARPGYSEHETGLAVDVNGKDGSYSYGIYNWMEENSYKYGFVIRYGKDKEKFTGISYEPWLIRYVGEKNAAIMKNNNLSLEEYLIEYYGKL